jgi:hypothetical protein
VEAEQAPTARTANRVREICFIYISKEVLSWVLHWDRLPLPEVPADLAPHIPRYTCGHEFCAPAGFRLFGRSRSFGCCPGRVRPKRPSVAPRCAQAQKGSTAEPAHTRRRRAARVDRTGQQRRCHAAPIRTRHRDRSAAAVPAAVSSAGIGGTRACARAGIAVNGTVDAVARSRRADGHAADALDRRAAVKS